MAAPERPLVGANCNLVNIVKMLQVTSSQCSFIVS